MKNIREMFNISYFDNKELNLKEHYDMYSNVKKDIINILNNYDIKYIVTDSEVIRDLALENKKLKEEFNSLSKGLSKIKNRRDVYKRRYLKLKSEKKQLSEEIGRLKQQNKFLMKRDNILQNLEQWLEIQSFDTSIGVFTSSAYQKVLNKIKELGGV